MRAVAVLTVPSRCLSSQALASEMGRIADVLVASVDPGRDADLRIATLALLDTLVSAKDARSGAYTLSDDALRPVVARIVVDGLVPNFVWRVGRVSATIRKVSIACLFAVLRRALLTDAEVRVRP